MEFRILGPLEVAHEGRLVALPRTRERAVLILLLLSPDRVVPAERLVDELWAGDPPAGALGALRVFVSRLRKALREAAGDDVILTKPPGYVARIDADVLDAACFESLVAEGRDLAARGDHQKAGSVLRRALSLWRGPALADAPDTPMVRAEAGRLEEARLTAIEERVEADLACRRFGELAPELDALTKVHPLRERLWGQRMMALYGSGRQADALRVFQELRRLLGDELGLAPGPEITRLEHAILRQAPELKTAERPALPPLTQRHNLPVSLTPFVGRAEELDELGPLLRRSRLLTLAGVGGAGKTRLALRLAERALEAYADGVWMVDLAPQRDGAQVPAAVAAAVGLETAGAGTSAAVEDRLAGHLAGREVLLLLDNCEHLVEPVAHLVRALLTRCSAVTALATSRELLGLPGEVAWRVPPLSLPPPGAAVDEMAASDAVGFFCERARAARPEFSLDAANAAAVARICRRLDGIPLAIELAAARIAILSPTQLADRLDDRFRLLTSRDRIAVSRHQTLRATLDWSYDLLSTAEQGALACLSVFPETFDLEAAEAVMALADPLAVLSRLVDKSLVVVQSEGPAPRYRLLETVRQYAAERLTDAGGEPAARRRHCDTFIARVEAWGGMILGADFMLGAMAETENFRAAQDWAWSQGDVDAVLRLLRARWVSWIWWGTPESHEWTDRLCSAPEFDAPEFADHPGRVFVLLTRALLVHGGANRGGRDRLMDEAAGLAERIGDDWLLSHVYGPRGEVSLLEGQADEARGYFETALAASERLGLPDGIGWCHDHLGWAAVAKGEWDRAREHFEQAVELARSDPLGIWLAPHALAGLAPLLARAGEDERALGLADEAVAAARELAAQPVLAMALTRTAETAALARRSWQARAALIELLSVLAGLGSQRWVPDALDLAALVLAEEGDADLASEILGAAEALRLAANEAPQGVRVIAGEVERFRDRLAGLLGTDRFQQLHADGRELSAEMAIARAHGGLVAAGAR